MRERLFLNDSQRRLAEQNLNIVSRVIYRHIIVNETLVGFEYDDLYQEGCIWLCKAAASFQTGKGVPFTAYAEKVVANGLRTHCRLMGGKQKWSCCIPLYSDSDILRSTLEQIPDITYQEDGMLTDMDVMQLLHRLKRQYTGTARLGIEAIELKVKGYSGKEIAAMYGVKPNLVGAWISRAKQKLRQNQVFILWMDDYMGQAAS
jgi:RNA polymerase sigma factor, sigma-70 family